MKKDRRPYIGSLKPYTWRNSRTGEQTPGLALNGAGGIAAHLTSDEAIQLADKLVDLAERLPQLTKAATGRQQTPCGLSPVHTSQTLTNASGDTEQPLPTSTLELE